MAGGGEGCSPAPFLQKYLVTPLKEFYETVTKPREGRLRVYVSCLAKVLSVVCHDILFHLIFYLKVYILLFIYGIYWTNLMYSGYGKLFIPPIFCWYFHRTYFQTVVPVHAQGL